MNNLNSGIPTLLVKTNELMALTTGTTYQNGATVSSPGALYSGYVCTHLYSSLDDDNFLTTTLDGSGSNIRIQLGKKGQQFAWDHTGYDIAGVDPNNNVISMCYCNDPCRAPFAISGETTPPYRNYGEQIIGSRPPMANPGT